MDYQHLTTDNQIAALVARRREYELSHYLATIEVIEAQALGEAYAGLLAGAANRCVQYIKLIDLIQSEISKLQSD